MPMADFADMGLYHIPPAVSGEERDEYRQDMLVIQELYRKHLRPGRLPQEARGLLPLNIMSNGMFGMRFRDLMNFMGQRLCVMSQNEIRRFGALLRAELVRVFPFLDKKLHCPCFGDDGQQFKPCVFTPLPEAKVIS